MKVSGWLSWISMTQNFETESLFLEVKCGFEVEFSWLKKLGELMEHLPLFIGKVLGWFGGRMKDVFSKKG